MLRAIHVKEWAAFLLQSLNVGILHATRVAFIGDPHETGMGRSVAFLACT
jgi:hypothetical protein